jgi:hypothetical protein
VGHICHPGKGIGYPKAAKAFMVPRQTFRSINKGDLEPQEAASTVLGRQTVQEKILKVG